MPCITVNIPPKPSPPSPRPHKPPAQPAQHVSAIDYLLPIAAGGLIIGGVVVRKIMRK